ncbi:phage tail terminator protein [Escherichia coli]
MEVNKKQLADIFGASIRTIQNWQEQGMPVLRGGGKGNEVLYDSAAVIKWYAERDAEIENEKLRREVEELRQASEADLQPGTIEYERHRLTRAQADAQELKNARDSAEVVETAFCTFVLSRIAGEIASILDGLPLSVQRRFPELENRHVDFLKRDIIKAMNKAAALDELICAAASTENGNKAMKHTELRAAVLDALEKHDTGATLFDGRPAVFDEEDFPAIAVYLTGAEYTGEELDSDTWQAELHIEVFLPAQVPDSELDSWMESRIYPVMSDIPALSDLITSMVASGYDYRRDDDAGLWSSADLTYVITYEM